MIQGTEGGRLAAGPVWEPSWVEFVVEVVGVEWLKGAVALRPVVPAAVVGVGMMVVASGEMRSVYADLLKEVVELQVWAGIVQGWAVVSGRVAGMYLLQCEEAAVLV